MNKPADGGEINQKEMKLKRHQNLMNEQDMRDETGILCFSIPNSAACPRSASNVKKPVFPFNDV